MSLKLVFFGFLLYDFYTNSLHFHSHRLHVFDIFMPQGLYNQTSHSTVAGSWVEFSCNTSSGVFYTCAWNFCGE